MATQSGYMTLDLAVRVGPSSKAWEVALIGRDLTNKWITTVGQDEGTVTPGVTADVLGIPARARQVLLQVTVRPNLF